MTVRVSLFGFSLLAYVAAGALPVAAQAPNFGDDSSIWAMDGECDDPRFVGDGMSSNPQPDDILADASDCRAAFDAGRVALDPAMADAQAPADRPAKPGEQEPPTEVADEGTAVDFGSDTSPWSNDGECDDPRFVGQGMAAQPQDVDIRADASDCRALFEAGSIQLAGGTAEPPAEVSGAVDFGADSGNWTNDGECDDPRFEGQGMASVLLDEDRFADATDCRTLYEAGMIRLVGEGVQDIPDGEIDFGADSGNWTNDGECDDPRFQGPGSAAVLLDEDRFADATDCRTLYEAGQVQYIGDGGASDPATIDFGADSGQWTNDGECDDPRFQGPGSAAVLLDEDRFADATDCRTLYEAGQVQYIGDGGGTVTANVDFGADSGQWTFDGECDDPRFQGNGMASVLVDADRFADATDCRTLYEAGQITYIGD